MDKKQLDSILKNAFNAPLWRQVLTDVFGTRNLNQTPQPIMLSSNSKDIAQSAFELGFFNTSDDRIIGLYQINLTDKPQIWRNRVGLRELLRNIYKHDVDGALVVFVQNDKWRLSFISEIRVLNDDGTIDTKATEPKRYTYLLGKNEKTKTPTDRLSLLINKKIALEDIRAAFSVEALNNDFYKNIAEYFYQLVGATTTKGKKTEIRQKTMSLPGVSETTPENRKLYQEFAVRLIGRTVFCWFLKVKKSESGKPLLPEKLLSSASVEEHKNYYHEILEPLFFQTLNTPMDKRLDGLPKGCGTVPFLNGGLFEPQIEDFYEFNRHSGMSNHLNTLRIPDEWFLNFFRKLEEYNFTIDENSPVEVEISVDPEMLGRIFENLLAEIDPDSGETARKATGSFYTPREVVNYMVDESLLIYLKSKLLEDGVGYTAYTEKQSTFWGNDARAGQLKLEDSISENHWKRNGAELEETLRKLFSYSEIENPFDEADTKRIIKAIDDCKILDPACGSGAFPIGVLQRLVYLLGKLDRKNTKWKQAQLGKIDSLIESAKEIDDFKLRGTVTSDLEKRKEEIEKDFANKELDFGRKLFLIENCIYGVDIQPIAAEISKLRCFLTLIVDDTIIETKPNRGVNPLPNLEFKFVTADALLKLPTSGLFQATTERQMSELEQIRHEYINSYGERKESAKKRFKQIQDEIFEAQIKNNRENPDKRAIALSTWNPFGHEKVNWFDSEWMFGVKEFDIVIGNPPYIQLSKDAGLLAKRYANERYETFERTGDIYCLFYEQGNNLLKKKGVLCYITSNKWMRAGYGDSTRNFFAKNTNPIQLIDFAGQKIFEAATVDTNILLFSKDKNQQETLSCVIKEKVLNNLSGYFRQNASKSSFNINQSWVVLSSIEQRIKEKIESVGTPLKDWDINIYRGILTGYNEAFIIDRKKKDELIAEDPKSAEIIRPILRGRDIKKYSYSFCDLWLINTHNGIREKGIKPINVNDYPAIKKHLDNFYPQLKARADKGVTPYNLRNCAYIEDFSKQKIVWGEISDKTKFAIELNGQYITEATTFLMVGKSLLFLVGYLNSKLSEYLFSKTGTTTGVGTVRWKKFTIERLLVPIVSEVRREEYEKIVYQIIEHNLQNQPFEYLEQRLNNLIYSDVGLSNDEITLIESFRQ